MEVVSRVGAARSPIVSQILFPARREMSSTAPPQSEGRLSVGRMADSAGHMLDLVQIEAPLGRGNGA